MLTTEQLYQLFIRYPKAVIDSRKISSGSLFFALKGERFNGNEFAEQAIEAGAAYAIIDEAQYDKGDQYILVNDVLTSLQNLAREHRRHFAIPLIAITGSNGKTTTKELLSTVMNSHYLTHFTKGNFNNHIGVPLTLLAMPKDTEVAIIEMGANHEGEIDFLCTIAEPTHGLITNIGKAHLEGFGGLDGVKRGKSELYRYLAAHNGVLFVNADEDHLEELIPSNAKVIYYEKSDQPSRSNPAQEVKLLATDPFIKVAFLSKEGELLEVQSQLMGHYNFNNILTALSIGKYFKVPGEKCKEAIASYVPSNNRSQIVKKGNNTFILDAYNANPTSMKMALKNLNSLKGQTKIAILGSMLELGKVSEEEHEELLVYAQSLALHQILLVGKEFSASAKKYDTLYFDNVGQLKDWFEQQNIQSSLILIKGSRGIQLEKLIAD